MSDVLRKIKMWLTGEEDEARRLLDRHVVTASIGLPTENTGDRQDDIDGAVSGGVIWGVEPNSHGAVSFLTSPIFLAFYDAKAGRVHLLDDVGGTRHPGQIPKVVGDDIAIEGPKRSGLGYVVRSAKIGEDGLYRNVFMLSGVGRGGGADLIAHHLDPDPPINSSEIYDPDQQGIKAGLHWAVRVRRWVTRLCGGKTSSGDDETFALMLNFGTNGDGTPAYGLAHFDRDEALLSDEGGGPLAAADDGRHVVAEIKDARGHQGGINIATALFGCTRLQVIYSPAEFVNTQWENGPKGLYPRRVEWREDFNARHTNWCGKKVPGFKKWQTWTNKKGYDTGPKSGDPSGRKVPSKDPTSEKDDDPSADKDKDPNPLKDPSPKTGDPPGPPRDPPAAIKSPEDVVPTLPSDAGPMEDESPSDYGHPRPGIPDSPGPGSDDHATASDWPATTPYEAAWIEQVGFTEEAWNRTPIVAHTDTMPVYTADAPIEQASNPHERWPTVKSSHEELQLDEDGRVTSRPKAAIGPGSRLRMPARMHAALALQENDARTTGISYDNYGDIVVAFKTADGRTADSRFGLGRRIRTSPFVASGFEFKLAYDGPGGVDTPDVHLTTKDEAAADDPEARLFIQGVQHGPDEAVLSGGTGGVGYATGAGGTVTQESASGKATGVEINTVCGRITTDNATLNAGAEVSFAVTNNAREDTDVVIVNHQSGGTAGAYLVQAVSHGDASFSISIRNLSGSNLSEALVLNFAIIKGATS